MDFYRIFNAIKSEYPENIALAAVQVYSLNMVLKPSDNFEAKIIKKAKKLLWQMSQNDSDLAVNIWRVIYTWECCQALHGMGGCKAKTFKQLIGEQNAN